MVILTAFAIGIVALMLLLADVRIDDRREDEYDPNELEKGR